MDVTEARAILTDPKLTDVGSPLQLAVTAVLNALDTEPTATEWGTRFYVGTARESINVHPNFDDAEEEAAAYGGVVVARQVGQWVEEAS